MIVRAVCIDNRSMVITEDIFALFLKLFAPGICSRRFTASSYQRPLESFLIVHRTLAFCWLILEAAGSWIFLCSKMRQLSSWRRLFLINDSNSMAMSFETKLKFWRRKRYKIGVDFFLYLSWSAARINTTACSSSLFLTDSERHHLDPANAMSLNCLCSSIFARLFGN